MVLSAQSVSKRWSDGTKAVQDFTAEFTPGAITALIGRNGSGKTTVLRLLAGLLTPDEGTIHRPAEQVGFLFQQGGLWPHLTVRGQVELTWRLVKKHRPDPTGVDHLLAKLKLMAVAERYPSELSGGQQQRAAIARCLCANPRILLLDEVTGSLDPVAQGEIYQIIHDLKEEGFTIIAATHDLSWARREAVAVLYMVEGRLKTHGNPDAVFSDEEDPMFDALTPSSELSDRCRP